MKFLKWFLIVFAVLALLFYFVGAPYLKEQTKKNSPEKASTYTNNGMDLSVTYSSPFKKGRVIFGELVPYDQVWRTGANEPTTFTCTSDITIMGNNLPAGTYSLWTIPNSDSWSVIFNNDIPGWGVTLSSGGSETTRKPENDVVQVQVPVKTLSEIVESLTIGFEEGEQLNLTFSWDTTKVSVPISN